MKNESIKKHKTTPDQYINRSPEATLSESRDPENPKPMVNHRNITPCLKNEGEKMGIGRGIAEIDGYRRSRRSAKVH